MPEERKWWGFQGSEASIDISVQPASPITSLTIVNAGCSSVEVLVSEGVGKQGKEEWIRLAKVREHRPRSTCCPSHLGLPFTHGETTYSLAKQEPHQYM